MSDRKRLYCNRCENETNHILHGEHIREQVFDWKDGTPPDVMRDAYRLWTCAGCEEGVMEAETSSSLQEDSPSFTYAPPLASSHLPVKIFRKLPPKLKRIYRESVKSFNLELNILCAAGLRALMEGICADKGANGRTLKHKIDALDAHLPKSIVQNLHGFRFMGNVAVHELTAPEPRELRIAIGVSEDLLNYLYELDYKASLLGKWTQKSEPPTTS